MVCEDSDFIKHPDWAFTIPGRKRCVHYQLVLDYSRKRSGGRYFAQIAVLELKVLIMSEGHGVKMDMNRHQ